MPEEERVEVALDDAHRRPIRSFVRREGRLTPAQSDALERLWPRYGIDQPSEAIHPAALFEHTAGDGFEVVLEIGFGAGEHLLARAASEPERGFIGIEVHRPGAGRLLRQAEHIGLNNLRVATVDAVEVLNRWLLPESLDELVLYFPDPWPKKRHHKRRLVQPGFAKLAARVLKPGGLWRLATDWANYAEQMREVLDHAPDFENIGDRDDGFATRPDSRPPTRFEQRGERLGHEVFDLVYRRQSKN